MKRVPGKSSRENAAMSQTGASGVCAAAKPSGNANAARAPARRRKRLERCGAVMYSPSTSMARVEYDSTAGRLMGQFPEGAERDGGPTARRLGLRRPADGPRGDRKS